MCRQDSASLNQKKDSLQCVSVEWGCDSVQGIELMECSADREEPRPGSNSNMTQGKGGEQPESPDGEDEDAHTGNGDANEPGADEDSGDDGNTDVAIAPPSDGQSTGSDSTMIAAIVGGSAVACVCLAAGSVALYCAVARRGSIGPNRRHACATGDAGLRYSAESSKTYGQQLSPEAQMRNELAKGRVVRTKPDGRAYHDKLSPQTQKVNHNDYVGLH